MAETEVMKTADSEMDAGVSRIYEVGYHISPSVKEEDIEKIVSTIRSFIEKSGGSFIAEGAPTLTKLSYNIPIVEGGKRVEYDRGYFGWIKFEAASSAARGLEEALKGNGNLLRFIVFQTVREDTRAKIKLGTLREVRRPEAMKAVTRREETAGPVSEEDLEKALQDLTAE